MIDRDHLTEDEAARLWQRAAALQSEAAHRAESLSGELEGAAGDPDESDDSPDSGYAIEHVRAAALEAGIGAEYLDAVLIDMKAERALPDTRTRGVLARRILPALPGAITIKRMIEASPNEVLEAMAKVLTGEPYHLVLSDRKGNVLDGGVLVFDIEGVSVFEEGFRGKAAGADVHQLYFSLHGVGDAQRCELTLRGPVAWAERRNAGIGAVLIAMSSGAGMVSVGGMGGTFAAGVAAAGLVSIPVAGVIAAGAAIAGFLGGGGAGKVGLRALHVYYRRQAEKALDGLLSAVALRAQGGWALGTDGADRASDPEKLPKLSP